MKLPTQILTLSALGLSLGHGALVYVDATSGVSGNTFNSTTGSSTDWAGPNNGTDNLWSLRTTGPAGVAFGASVYEKYVAETTAPILRTTITGLVANATYTGLRLYYVGNAQVGGLNDWAIAATVQGSIAGGPTGGTFVTYPDNSGNALVDSTSDALGTAEPGTPTTDTRYWVALPDATTDASGNLSVWINIGTGANNRAAYDGIAYDDVPVIVPETSVALLGGLGALGLLRRRRR